MKVLTPEQENAAKECSKQCIDAVDIMMEREKLPETSRQMIRETVMYMGEKFAKVLAATAMLSDIKTARIGARAVVAWMSLAVDGMLTHIPENEEAAQRTSEKKAVSVSHDA